MKQGRAVTSMNEFKREPRSEAINPGGAAQLGTMVVKNPTPLVAGRGFEAPKPKAEISHRCGSQGEH